MSPAERRAVAEFLTGRPAGEGAGLAADVPRLKLKWAFRFRASPPLGAVFSGSLDGHLRAYASDTG